MARIAVAATAPFGADVLERLAARHEISALLTRPDARQGRGRRVAPPPAKLVAARLGVPVLQPERPAAGARPRRARRSSSAPTACLIPEELLSERDVAQRPSLAPAALARRRARRARDPGRRRRDGRDDPRDREGARRRPDRRAGALPDRARRRRGRGVRAGGGRRGAAARRRPRRPEPRRSCRRATTASPTPTRSSPPTACSTSSAPAEELVRRVRALSPHIGARAELHGRPVTVWRARVGETGAFEPVEVQPDGGKRMDAAAWLRGLR